MEQALIFIGEMLTGGVGVFLFTAGAKKVAGLQLGENRKTVLRAIAGILSAGAALLIAFADGAVQPEHLQNVALGVLNAATIWATAHAVHKGTKKIKEG